MTRSRIGVLITTTWNIRNVIYSGLLEDLKQSVEPILLVRDLQASPLKELNHLGVQVEPMQDELAIPPWSVRLRRWSDAAFAQRYRIATRRLHEWWFHRRHWSRTYQVKHALTHGLITRLLSISNLFRQADRLERIIYARANNPGHIQEQLTKLNIDALVSTLYFHRWERPYLRTARDMGLTTICVIPSFDNLWVWGMLPIPFDYYVVWHERMRHELTMLYPDVAREDCFVTGTPQFDFHVRPEWTWNREETAQYWRLDPDRLWYLYTGNAQGHTPTEPSLLGEMISTFEDACLLQRGCLIVRPHPLDSYERWSSLQNHEPQVSVRYPWSQGKQGLAQSDLTDHVAWVNLLRHSAVCMNVGSSTTLDAAAVDCPIVLINFAAPGHSEEDRYYKYFNFSREHYRPIACHSGLRVANDLKDLIRHVQEYAAKPELDRAARQQMAQEFCGRLDGQSAKRVTEAIVSVMNRGRTHR